HFLLLCSLFCPEAAGTRICADKIPQSLQPANKPVHKDYFIPQFLGGCPLSEMAGVSGCLKYSMFFFNFLFWVCGTLILALSIWLRVSKDGKEIISAGDSGTNPYIAVNILIAVGAVIMVLGFLGCCGAVKESRCMLLLSSLLNETLHENVKLLTETTAEAKEFQQAMISLQTELQCCGLVKGAADWGNNFVDAKESCKCPDTPDAQCTTYSSMSVNAETCLSLIREIVEKNLIIVIGIAFGLAVIEPLSENRSPAAPSDNQGIEQETEVLDTACCHNNTADRVVQKADFLRFLEAGNFKMEVLVDQFLSIAFGGTGTICLEYKRHYVILHTQVLRFLWLKSFSTDMQICNIVVNYYHKVHWKGDILSLKSPNS
ncbi:hypothetical protein STEG23_034521, partial [Scotinomys teguina]